MKSKESDRAGPDREERQRLLRRLVHLNFHDRRELWKLGAFAELNMGELALFEALVSHMSVERLEAFPSQPLLAREIRCSVRSVERWTPVLVKLGIINEPRVLRVRGVLHYELGPSAYAAIREYIAQHPTPARAQDWDAIERNEKLELELAAATAREQNAAIALLGEAAAVRIRCIPSQWRVASDDSARPAAVSSEGRSLSRSQTPSSSSDRAHEREEEKVFEIDFSKVDEKAARVALTELATRKRPDRPPFVDAKLVVVAARCAAVVVGDFDAKLRALRLAIEGAYAASSGPPSVRYIFGEPENFEDHVWRAESRARALERKPQNPPRECIARPSEPPIDRATALEALAEIERNLASTGTEDA